MLQLSQKLLEVPILSLRTGDMVAVTGKPLFNPNNLKIEGFYCTDRFTNGELILLAQDIREQLPEGFVVNDHEVLADPTELVRLKKLINLAFELKGKVVQTISKDRIGKVSDFAVDCDSFYVVKLYVSRPLIKNLTGGHLVVDRNQINEITNQKIIIDDLLQANRLRAAVRS